MVRGIGGKKLKIMSESTFFRIASALVFAFFLGLMISDIGSMPDCEPYDWNLPAGWVAMFIGIFWLGYNSKD